MADSVLLVDDDPTVLKYLTTLLERRQSHPLTFAALYRDLARSVGLPVEIVALPGTVALMFVDGWGRTQSLYRCGLGRGRSRISRRSGPRCGWRPGLGARRQLLDCLSERDGVSLPPRRGRGR